MRAASLRRRRQVLVHDLPLAIQSLEHRRPGARDHMRLAIRGDVRDRPGACQHRGVIGETVDVHVAALRAKLGPALPISTVRGQGYRVDPTG